MIKNQIPVRAGTWLNVLINHCFTEVIYCLSTRFPGNFRRSKGHRNSTKTNKFMKLIHLFRCNVPYVASKQLLRIMKLIIVIMTTFLIQVSASGFAQHFTLKKDNISLKDIFVEVKKQTGYAVVYRSSLIKNSKPIDVNLNNTPLKDAMSQILQNQNLDFTIEDKVVILKEKEKSFFDNIIARFQDVDVRGKVLDETGNPLAGATITVKG